MHVALPVGPALMFNRCQLFHRVVEHFFDFGCVLWHVSNQSLRDQISVVLPQNGQFA